MSTAVTKSDTSRYAEAFQNIDTKLIKTITDSVCASVYKMAEDSNPALDDNGFKCPWPADQWGSLLSITTVKKPTKGDKKKGEKSDEKKARQKKLVTVSMTAKSVVKFILVHVAQELTKINPEIKKNGTPISAESLTKMMEGDAILTPVILHVANTPTPSDAPWKEGNIAYPFMQSIPSVDNKLAIFVGNALEKFFGMFSVHLFSRLFAQCKNEGPEKEKTPKTAGTIPAKTAAAKVKKPPAERLPLTTSIACAAVQISEKTILEFLNYHMSLCPTPVGKFFMRKELDLWVIEGIKKQEEAKAANKLKNEEKKKAEADKKAEDPKKDDPAATLATATVAGTATTAATTAAKKTTRVKS